MLESLVGMLGSFLDVLSKIKKSDKKKIGKELAKLYIELAAVIENGENILQFLTKIEKKVKINTTGLLKVLSNQASRIERIKSVIKKSRIETVFKIHLPKISDLEILIEQKGLRIAIFTEQMKELKKQRFRYFHPEKLTYFRMFDFERIKPILIPPKKVLIEKTHKDFNKLKRLVELFRFFIIDKFEIDEII